MPAASVPEPTRLPLAVPSAPNCTMHFDACQCGCPPHLQRGDMVILSLSQPGRLCTPYLQPSMGRSTCETPVKSESVSDLELAQQHCLPTGGINTYNGQCQSQCWYLQVKGRAQGSSGCTLP